jgi:hexokinase
LVDLTAHQLEEIIQALRLRIEEGLANPDQEVRCLPAFLEPPRAGLSGKALVVDAGGTNLRAAWVDLDNHDQPVQGGPEQQTLFVDRDHQVDREKFFKMQTDMVGKIDPPANLPLGYCFSYPVDVHADGDATLIRWNKGVHIAGVVGTLVGKGLADALAGAGHPVTGVKVLNDTVASLVGGVWGAPAAEGFIGLIVGTGTNMATFLPTKRVHKLESDKWPHEQIAINLESGNFHPPHLTEYDEAVDRASDNVGRQRFEKAVSGYYLPFVFEQVCPGFAGFDPKKGSGQLSDILASSKDERAWEAARWLVHRSADLVAAGLAALAYELKVNKVAIQAEGTLFWKTPGYRERVEQTLARLAPEGCTCEILHVVDVNLVGAACAALG